MDSPAPDWPRRLASASGALLLQGGFLLLLLYSMPRFQPARYLGREMTLILPRLRMAVPPPRLSNDANPLYAPPVLPSVPWVSLPILPSPSVTPIVPRAVIEDFGRALNDCTPENYANLPEERQARCPAPGAGLVVLDAPNLMGTPSQVKDLARWTNALAHEQSPLALPCAMPVHTIFGSGPAFDFACLAQAFVAGTLTDPMTWPTYETTQWQPEDFYTIAQSDDEWNTQHAKPRDGATGKSGK